MAILAGLAIHLREDVASLAIVLAALLASFMVSYGSAKAEALRVPVPPGSMRRLERSVCLCAGVALVPVARALVAALGAATWLAEAPILVALAVVAIVGNASAVARLRVVAALARPTNGEAPGRTQAVRAP
jgi:CDP-diacylglycerol--glycerol-3-phosphate 3-phosphatidyltransferase